MGREVLRVPLDFDHKGVWPGYVDYIDDCPCDKFKAAKWTDEDGTEHIDEDDCALDSEKNCPYQYPVPTGPGWQVWETVSEGSPATPVFATKEELIDHIVKYGMGGIFRYVSREAAERFVDRAWCPTAVMTSNKVQDGTKIYDE